MSENQHDLEYENDPDVLYLPDPPEPEVIDPWEAPDPNPWEPPYILLDEADDLRQEAGQLLDTENFLEEVKASLSGRYAGPTYPVELVVLALYSRQISAPRSRWSCGGSPPRGRAMRSSGRSTSPRRMPTTR